MTIKQEELLKTQYGLVFCSFVDNQEERTLVFLHGNSSSANFWKPLMESELREAFNFLTFDLPGHGNSPVPENPQETYSLTAYADLLLEIISKFDLKNYFLLGHSLGGHIILESLDGLSDCKGAIVMGTPPLTLPPQLEMAFLMSPQFISFMQSGTDRGIMESTFKSMVPEDNEALADLLFEDYFKTDPQAREFLTQNIYQGKFVDELKVLQQTEIPVYIVIAEQDQMVNPAYFTHFLSDQELIRVPAAGHYAPLEKPEAFVRLILERFIA